MKDDWRAHRDTGDFDMPMTPAYAPHGGQIQPIGYGLVVADQQQKVLLSAQDYTTFGRISGWTIANDLGQVQDLEENPNFFDGFPDLESGTNLGELINQGVGEDVKRFITLYKAGRIRRARTKDPPGQGLTTHDLQNLTLNEILERLKNNSERRLINGLGPIYGFPLEMAPYELETFQLHKPKDMQAMYERIQQLGFRLSPEEQQAWKRGIQGLDQAQPGASPTVR